MIGFLNFCLPIAYYDIVIKAYKDNTAAMYYPPILNLSTRGYPWRAERSLGKLGTGENLQLMIKKIVSK